MLRLRWIQSPCKDCKDRHLKCHATCEKFLEYREKYQAERERLFKENALDKAIKQMNYDGAKSKEKLPEPLRHGRKRK